MAKPDVTTLPIFASEDTPELGATIRPTDEMQKFGIPSGGVWGREFLNWQFKSIGEWLEWVNNFALDSEKNLSDVNAIQAKINLGLDRVQNVADKDKVASDATKALIANLSGVTDVPAARNRLGLTSTATTMLTQSIRDVTEGRVLKVGDFGIGKATYLGDSTDLNSLNTPSHVGKYYQDTNVNTSTALGYPELAAGSLEVSEAAGVVQVYTVYSSGNIYSRGFYNGTWSTWQKVIRTSDLSASTNNTSTTTPASVAGVKLAYDRGTTAIVQVNSLGTAAKSNIVQVTGQSTTNVMSQVAVTNSLLGVGQTWRNVTWDRAVDTTYTNDTGKPIMVSFTGDDNSVSAEIIVNGVMIARSAVGKGSYSEMPFVTALIPNGATYRIIGTKYIWAELR